MVNQPVIVLAETDNMICLSAPAGTQKTEWDSDPDSVSCSPDPEASTHSHVKSFWQTPSISQKARGSGEQHLIDNYARLQP